MPTAGTPIFFQNNGRNGTFGFLELGSSAAPRVGGGGGGGEPACPGGGEIVPASPGGGGAESPGMGGGAGTASPGRGGGSGGGTIPPGDVSPMGRGGGGGGPPEGGGGGGGGATSLGVIDSSAGRSNSDTSTCEPTSTNLMSRCVPTL